MNGGRAEVGSTIPALGGLSSELRERGVAKKRDQGSTARSRKQNAQR
jgi:hypothetical protein